jgi:glutamate dehydrogenase
VRLVAAFNHQHIFIDPDPDPARSFTERLRLFALPRSSWADYDASLISPGGGVFPRSAKRIAISEPMRRRFAIQAEALTPVELIAALLRAPLDLLWNGGIGTYVKASSESHADVGDKANDAVRIDGRELGARVVGEGGNLGMTQLGRVEYALAGGACNTDFIDNAGGVNCSDHEVNLKILCGELLARGQLERAQRDRLLAGLTEAVAQQVLRDNYKQAQALSIARRRARERQGEYQRLIAALEAGGLLDRGLEYLPSDEQLAERAAAGEGLTRPELAVLMAYSKLELKTALLQSPLPDAPYLTAELASAFPAELEPAWRAGLAGHRLRREIIATQLANDLVNHMGITFVQRLRESTGMDAAAIVQAYTLVRELFRLPYWWQQVEALEQSLPAELQLSLMEALMRLGRRATRWFLRNRRRQSLDVPAALQQFAERLPQLGERLGELLQGAPREQWQAQYREYLQAGVPAALAQQLAAAGHLYSLLAVIDAADTCASEPLALAELFFRVGAELGLDTYHQQVTALPVHNHWQALAREAYRDDLEWQQRSLSVSVLRSAEGESAARLEHWLAQHAGLVQRWRAMLVELRTANAADYALYAVANRELLDLAQSAAGEGG